RTDHFVSEAVADCLFHILQLQNLMAGAIGIEPAGTQFYQLAGDKAFSASNPAHQADYPHGSPSCRSVPLKKARFSHWRPTAKEARSRDTAVRRANYTSASDEVTQARPAAADHGSVSAQLRPLFTSTTSGTSSFITPDMAPRTNCARGSSSSAGASNNNS